MESVLVIKTSGVIPKEISECLDKHPEMKNFMFVLDGLRELEPGKISNYGQQWIWYILNM